MHISENPVPPQGGVTRYVYLKMKNQKLLVVIIGVVAIIAVLFFKGLLVAAIVDGSPISRLSVIRELEKQGGKQALEAMIQEKLIQAELNKKAISVTTEEVDAQIKKIEVQVTSRGGTLKDALAAQGLTEEKLREQIKTQKKLEKLLADKITVSDAEIDTYLKENKITSPKNMKSEDFKKQVGAELSQQKFQQEAQKWIADLKTHASIKYYVTY